MRGIALALLVALSAHAASAEIIQAQVTGGAVSGVAADGMTVFKGIPFAAPPVGDLRWKAPAPVEPWTGVKKADAFADACMQAPNSQGNTAPVSEDCLYLNVWTPAKSANDKIPVIVWIHGGGFVGGSTSISMYDGSGYARKGVILVSLAYRLGPFGFMASPALSRESGHGSGTYGIQDSNGCKRTFLPSAAIRGTSRSSGTRPAPRPSASWPPAPGPKGCSTASSQ